MSKFIKVTLIPMLIALLIGCNANERTITIADYVLGGDYEIIEVDGSPAERVSSNVASVVPIVLVSEGTHRLKVRYRKTININETIGGDVEEVLVSVEHGKKYRIMRVTGNPTLVEVNN